MKLNLMSVSICVSSLGRGAGGQWLVFPALFFDLPVRDE